MRTSKEAKEAFYRGHSGASKLEIAALTCCLPLSIILSECLCSATGRLKSRRHVFMIEYTLQALLQVLVSMGALPPIPTCAALMLAAAGFMVSRVVTLQRTCSQGVPAEQQQQQQQQQVVVVREALRDLAQQRTRWVAALRGGLMMYTCCGILAVDFRAFPRRYAKAQTWGTGLMDVGIGGITLASGLSSSSWVQKSGSRATAGRSAGGQAEQRQHRFALAARLVSGLRAAAPCWVLWAGRLVSVRVADYQEAVSEYGVHWNFFATVALVTLAAHLLGPLPSWRAALLAALAVTVLHQAALQLGGLGPWALSDERPGLGSSDSDGDDGGVQSWWQWAKLMASLNKEGLTSVPGHLALRLWGAALGGALRGSLAGPADRACALLGPSKEEPEHEVSQQEQRATRSASRRSATESSGSGQAHHQGHGGLRASKDSSTGSLLASLLPLWPPLATWGLASGGLWVVVLLSERLLEPVSRRTCNLPYILWLVATCVTLVLILIAAQPLLSNGLQPLLVRGFSRNMLGVFLAANLMTGGINLAIDTLAVPDVQARAIVAVYMLLNCMLAVGLDAAGVTLKI